MKTLRTTILFMVLLFGITKSYSQAELNINDIKIYRGQRKTISVELINSVEIRAFQMHITFPEHIRLTGRPKLCSERIGLYTDEFGNEVQSSVMLNYRIKDDGSVVIVVNSTDAVPFKGSVGAIITLPIIADENAKVQSDVIEIKDMELVLADGCTFISPRDKVCKVNICGTATSLEELKDVFDGPVNVYTLDGILIGCMSIEKAEASLSTGIYLIDSIKVVINNKVQ